LVNPALQEIVVCERDNPQKVFDSFPLWLQFTGDIQILPSDYL
jgi:hypothetical protein